MRSGSAGRVVVTPTTNLSDIIGDAMRILKMMLTAVLFLAALLPAAVHAGGFDESRWITGAVDRLIEVNGQRVIEGVDPDTAGLPKAFVIDLERRTMRGTPESLVRRVASVERITRTATTLILQGVDEGISGPGPVFGWNLVIDTATGRAVLSASGGGIAYVAFGTCSPSAGVLEKGADNVPDK